MNNFDFNTNHQHSNSQISCDVKNCKFHDGQATCTAKQITVGPTFAVNSTDTACSTFKAED